MIREKLDYLFAETGCEASDIDRLNVLVRFDENQTLLSQIKEMIQKLAVLTRSKEKEEYRLSQLPDITNDTSADSAEFSSASKINIYSMQMHDLRTTIFRSIPKPTIAGKAKSIYEKAVYAAIEYRVLEGILDLHMQSCDEMIDKYAMSGQTDKAASFCASKDRIRSEFMLKIERQKEIAASLLTDYLERLPHPIVLRVSNPATRTGRFAAAARTRAAHIRREIVQEQRSTGISYIDIVSGKCRSRRVQLVGQNGLGGTGYPHTSMKVFSVKPSVSLGLETDAVVSVVPSLSCDVSKLGIFGMEQSPSLLGRKAAKSKSKK